MTKTNTKWGNVSNFWNREGELACGFYLDAKEPEDGFFFVAAVASGVDANCWEFASFAPPFDGEWGDSENFSNFANG